MHPPIPAVDLPIDKTQMGGPGSTQASPIPPEGAQTTFLPRMEKNSEITQQSPRTYKSNMLGYK